MSAEEQKRKSDALKARGTALTIDLFQEFYGRLKAAGIQFAQIQRGKMRSADGLVVGTVEEVARGGEFAVAKSCVLGLSCQTEPRVDIKGYGVASMSIW